MLQVFFHRLNIHPARPYRTLTGDRLCLNGELPQQKVDNLWAPMTQWNLPCNEASPGRSARPHTGSRHGFWLVDHYSHCESLRIFFLLDVALLKIFIFEWIIGWSWIEYAAAAGRVEWCSFADGLMSESRSLQWRSNTSKHLPEGSCVSSALRLLWFI